MAQVFKVVVRCPVSGREYDTGIRTSGREVLSSGVYQDGMAQCPHCGGSHSLDGNSFLRLDTVATADSLWRPNP